jgi:hypothetical protein
MGQQNLSFVEQHIEKVVAGVGALLAAAGVFTVVSWVGATPQFKAGEITQSVKQVEDALKGQDSTVNPAALAGFDEALAAASAPPSPEPVNLTVAFAAPNLGHWPFGRPDAGGPTIVEGPQSGEFTKDLTPPKPAKPEVALAIGYAGEAKLAAAKADARGSGPTITVSFGPKEEYVAVHLKASLDLKGTLEKWWEMYPYLRAKAEEIRRREALPRADFEAADKKYESLVSKFSVLGLEVQYQRFDPVTGWPADWKPLDRHYGLAGQKDWFRLASGELPKRGERNGDSDAAKKAAEKYKNELGKVFRVYREVKPDLLWPVPPGPENSAGAVELMDRLGRRLPGIEGARWPQLPKVETVSDPDAKPEKPKAEDAGDPDDPEAASEKPKEAVVKDEKPKEAKEGIAERTKDREITARCKEGTVRWLSAIAKNGLAFGAGPLVPGQTYRFRVRILVRNPAMGWEYAAEALENRFALSSEWSDPTDGVTVPTLHRFFVVGVQSPGGQTQPMIEIHRWIEGQWYKTKPVPVSNGSAIRPDKLLRLQGIDVKKFGGEAAAMALFDTGCTLVDVREDVRVYDRLPNKTNGSFKELTTKKLRITYQDPYGVLKTQVQSFDVEDQKKFSGGR